MRGGHYKGWEPLLLLGNDVHHKTLGIVGFGRIGYAVAKRAKGTCTSSLSHFAIKLNTYWTIGFDMKILYTDVDDKPYAAEVGAQRVDMETLLKESDFISLHPFLDPSTTHLIDEPQLRMMKKSAIIVNASRGNK